MVSEDRTLKDFYSHADASQTTSGDSKSAIPSTTPDEYYLCYVGPLWTEAEHTYPPTWPAETPEPLELQTLALKELGVLCVELKPGLHNDTVLLPPFARLLVLAVPSSALDIPFGTYTDLPEPFNRQSEGQLVHFHLSEIYGGRRMV